MKIAKFLIIIDIEINIEYNFKEISKLIEYKTSIL
jgi:hypothetical protein